MILDSDLKQLAIKWVKEDLDAINNLKDFNVHEMEGRWVRRLNITEEDLKNG